MTKIFDSKDWVNTYTQDSFLIEEGEIFSDLDQKIGSTLFLGKYTLNEVRAVLKKRNFFKEAQRRNLWPLTFDLDSTQFPPLQRLQIFYQQKKPENLVVDLKIKEGVCKNPATAVGNFSLSGLRFLILEWLTLQNPLLSFSKYRGPLPGQNHPGLSLGKKVLDLFSHLALVGRNDGLLAFPAYFHNALLFSRAFYFINPEKKGEVLAIVDSFPKISFNLLAWVVHLGCLKHQNGQVYEWQAEGQIHPVNKRLKTYFESKPYKEKVLQARRNLKFSIDWDCYKKKLASSVSREC